MKNWNHIKVGKNKKQMKTIYIKVGEMKKEMNDFKLNSVKEIKCLSPEDNSEHIMKVCQKSKVELRRVLIF